MDPVMIALLVVVLLVLVILIAAAVSREHHRDARVVRVVGPYWEHGGRHHRHQGPFCRHTAHGCCADGRTPKVDRRGSNCPLY